MNLRAKSRKTETAEDERRQLKRLALRVTIGQGNLAQQIMQAFNLAKSSGQELDLTFLPQKV